MIWPHQLKPPEVQIAGRVVRVMDNERGNAGPYRAYPLTAEQRARKNEQGREKRKAFQALTK